MKRLIDFALELAMLMAMGVIFSGRATDPGEYVFLFVYESTVLLLAAAAYIPVVLSGYLLWKNRKMLFKSSFFKKITAGFAGVAISLGGVFLFILVVGLLVVATLNQITVELLIGYLKNNDYQFESIKILSENGLYLSSGVRNQFAELFGTSYYAFFWIMFIKSFIQMTVGFLLSKDFRNVKEGKWFFNALQPIVVRIFLSPILMFVACLFLVIGSTVAGTQLWIVVTTLIIFRLLFAICADFIEGYVKKL